MENKILFMSNDEMKEWQDMALQAMSEDDGPEYDSAGFTENDRFVNEQNSDEVTGVRLLGKNKQK